MQINTCVVIVFTLAVVSGCSEGPYELAPVSGTLTCSGQPVPNGIIWFTPQDWEGSGRPEGFRGKPGHAKVQPDGTWEVTTYERGDGALIGPHKLTFEPPQPLTRDDLDGATPEEREQLMRDYPPFKISCSLQLNVVEFEVQPGDNQLELTLTP